MSFGVSASYLDNFEEVPVKVKKFRMCSCNSNDSLTRILHTEVVAMEVIEFSATIMIRMV